MADVNPGRGLNSGEMLKALKALGSDMSEMAADVAGIEADVAGLRGIIPRGTRAAAGAPETAKDSEAVAKSSQASLRAATERLEVLKLQTAELVKQQELIRLGGTTAGGVVLPGAPYRPGGGGAAGASAFASEDFARRLERIIRLRTGGAAGGIIPPTGGFGLAVPSRFAPVTAPQSPLAIFGTGGSGRRYAMPPGQQHAVETALQRTAVEMDSALIEHAREVARSAGLVLATGYRPRGERGELPLPGPSGRIIMPGATAPGSLILPGSERLGQQRATGQLVQNENAATAAKARQAELNSILIGQENERVAITKALDAELEKQLALRRAAATLPAGLREQTVRDLAGLPRQGALDASGRALDYGVAANKGYPLPFALGNAGKGLPISYVNQGPAFQQKASEAEFFSGAASKTAQRDIEGMTSRINRLGIVQAEASQQMRRHGALTTEFLTALARGETTLSEFGYHISATTAKFAGWTAAAAGVYFVLDGVKHLGEGAVETANGVATLSRFFEGDNPLDKRAATQGFRDVSGELNVPIKDVAQAQAVFARTFKDQDDSLTAAKVSIQAYKLDQISAADSQRYFTAIVQEFGLSAKDLPVIFDQISAAQRRMGARVSETLPAVARSAAAVKNAGGDMNQLIALAATAQVASGQTGNVVGTAFSRAASNFFRRPDNQKVLQSYGLDPSKGFTQLLVDAVHKSSNLSGIERTQIARAIGGPQFGGRVFQTLLGQQTRLDRTITETAPGRARGSAAEETEKQLKRIDEQISKVGNNLQRIGSALGETGALLPLGLALKTLNLMLSTTQHLIEAFDRLPGPAKTLLSLLVEGRIALALMRRTALGAGAADALGITVLGPSRAERARRQAIIGARSGEQTAANRLESLTGRSTLAAAEAQSARISSVSLGAQAANEKNAVRRVALQQAQVAAEARYKELSSLSLALEAEALSAEEQMTMMRERRIALQKRQITGTEAMAAETAIAAPGVIPLGREQAREDLNPVVKAAEREGEQATREITGRTGAIRRTGSEIAALGKRMGSAVGAFADSLGWFGLIFGGFIIGEVLKAQIEGATEAIEKQNKDLDRVPHSLEALKRRAADAGHAAKHGPQTSLRSEAIDAFLHNAPGVALLPFGGPLGFEAGRKLSEHFLGPSQKDIQTAADKARQNADNAIIHARKSTITSDVQNVGLANREILGYAQRDVDNIDKWGQTRGEFNKRFDRYVRDVGVSIEVLSGSNVSQGTLDKLNQIRAQGDKAFGATKDDPFAAFRHQSLAGVAGYADLLGTRAQVYGGKGQDLDTLFRALTFEIAKHGSTNDPKALADISKIQAAINNYIETMGADLEMQVRKIQDTGSTIDFHGRAPSGASVLGRAETQAGQTVAAYDRAIAGLQREKAHVDDGFRKASSGLTKAQHHLDELRREKREGTRGGPHDSIAGGGDDRAPDNIDKQIDAAVRERDIQKKRVDKIRAAQGKSRDKIQQQIDKYEQAKFDVASSEIDLRSAYQQSIASDKSDQIEKQIQADKDKVALALKYHGPGRWAKILAAQTKLNEDLASQADQHLQEIQKEGDLATSRITAAGPAADNARLQSQLSTARRVLAAARAEAPNPNKKDHIRDSEIAVNQLLQQINAQAVDDAKNAHDLARALYDSRMAIRMAGETDPLKLDRLQLEQDKRDMAFIRPGDFKTRREYLTALNEQKAKVRGDETKLRQDTIGTEYEDAQYLHNIGRLTDDSYIAQLRQILHMKGISKQMKRQLNEEIYRMTHADAEGGLDLNVGNIRLPSIYEVRRAMRAGQGATSGGTTINHHATVHVAVSRDVDLGKLGTAMEDTFGGPVTANLRAAGVL